MRQPNLPSLLASIVCLVALCWSPAAWAKAKSNTQVVLPNATWLADVDGDTVAELIHASTGSGAANRLFVTRLDAAASGAMHLYLDADVSRVIAGQFCITGEMCAGRESACAILSDNSFRCFASPDGVGLRQWARQANFIAATEQAIVGDFNGDGRDDILVYVPATGAFRLYARQKFMGALLPAFSNIGLVPGALTASLINRQIRAGHFNAASAADGLVSFVPSTGQVQRFDASLTATGAVTFALAWTATTTAVNHQVRVAALENSGTDGLAFWNATTGAWLLRRATLSGTTLAAPAWTITGQLPIVKGAKSAVVFGRLGTKPVGEAGGTVRDDCLAVDGGTSRLIRTDARYNSASLLTPYTWWLAWSRPVPTLGSGWPVVRHDKWLILKCAFNDTATSSPFAKWTSGWIYAGRPDLSLPDPCAAGCPLPPAAGYLTAAQKAEVGPGIEYIDPIFQNDTLLQHAMTKAGAGMGGLYDYTLEVTSGGIELNQIDISKWVAMNVANDQPFIPAGSPGISSPWRATMIDLCAERAKAVGVPTAPYAGIVAIWNMKRDSGAPYLGPLSADNKDYPRLAGKMALDLDSDAMFNSVLPHEFFHGLGMSHARADYISDIQIAGAFSDADAAIDYGDPFDVMGHGNKYGPSSIGASWVSYHLPVFNPDVDPGQLAASVEDDVELSAPHRAQFKLLPASRIVTLVPTYAYFKTQQVTLTAINRPEGQGALMVKIPVCQKSSECPSTQSFYTVELRQGGTGWDAALPFSAVLVHRVDGVSTTLVQKPGYTGATAALAPVLAEGAYREQELAASALISIKVKVLGIDHHPGVPGKPAHTAVVEITY